ncbi:hypothetical protein SETIT_5G088700v2 [Setaria italica]|uniref:Uncharacterized protein n=1 Tax=Setaria italica TaxID=4555 RepID=A0A368R353_SETIT|nr:hypothetical protein SETIT_5G088700v2 [Setaria italica]
MLAFAPTIPAPPSFSSQLVAWIQAAFGRTGVFPGDRATHQCFVRGSTDDRHGGCGVGRVGSWLVYRILSVNSFSICFSSFFSFSKRN